MIFKCNKADYKKIKQVGRGNYGIVYEAERTDDGKKVAIKMPVDKNLQGTLYSTQEKEKIYSKILDEINLLDKIGDQSSNNHIIPLLDFKKDKKDPIMVMPLCDETLSAYCRDFGEKHKCSCIDIMTWIEQILTALSYMKKNNPDSIHRDVKIENILMKDKQVYLSDFGTQKILTKIGTSSLAGTMEWGCPEQFIPRKIDQSGNPEYVLTDKADIYPVGLILFMLITSRGNLPQAQGDLLSHLDARGCCLPSAPKQFQKIGGLKKHEKQLCLDNLMELAKKDSLLFPEEFSNECIIFLENLLCPIIEKRYNSEDALEKLQYVKDYINPQLIRFNVDYPKRIQIGAELNFSVQAKGKGLAPIQKWLKIYSNKKLIKLIKIKPIINKNNNWVITLPCFEQKGINEFNLKTFDKRKDINFKIEVYETPEMLWKTKQYEKALFFIDHENYNKWLNQIEQDSKKSIENRDNWLEILDKIHMKVMIKKRPDLFVVIAKLVEMKHQDYVISDNTDIKNNDIDKENPVDQSIKRFWPFKRKKISSNKKLVNNDIIIPDQHIKKTNIRKKDFIHNDADIDNIVRLNTIKDNKKHYSDDEIIAIIKKNNFYYKYLNPSGNFVNDFVDNGDGTVIDRKTGLMWEKSGSNYVLNFKKAEDYIISLNNKGFAGYNDWRLPTIEELASLLESSQLNNDLYIDPLFDSQQRWCWSSTTRSSGSWWVVNFFHGNVYWRLDDFYNYVRGVRARQY